MAADKITIKKGATYVREIRWETYPIKYALISAIEQSAPVIVTAVAHGIPDGWSVARITGTKGMTQINTHQLTNGQYSLTGTGRRFPNGIQATVIDDDTLSFADINAQTFSVYDSLGMLEYYTPVNLSGYEARMQIRASASSSTVLMELDSTTNNRIVLDNTNKTITLTISATDTAAIAFTSGVASLEMTDANGVVTLLIDAAPVIVRETDITRD